MTESELPAWSELNDELLRGIGHELNNRVGAVRAVIQVILGDLSEHDPLAQALATEGERLQRTVDLLRLLPARSDEEEEEAFRVEDLIAEVGELLALHPDLYGLQVRLERVGEPVPVRANRPRTFGALLAAAARVATVESGVLRVRVVSDAEYTVARLVGADGAEEELALRHMLA